MLEINIKLKPCPFCGNDVIITNLSNTYDSEINNLELSCQTCNVNFSIEEADDDDENYLGFKKSPIDIWNSRKFDF